MVSLGRRASLHQGLSSNAFSELANAHYFNLAMVKYGGRAKKLAEVLSPATRLPKELGPGPWLSSPGTQRTTGHDLGANLTPLHPLLRLLPSSMTDILSLSGIQPQVSDPNRGKHRSMAQIVSLANMHEG